MKLMIFLAMLPLVIQAQSAKTDTLLISHNKGINWIENLNWEQIRLKAMNENKLIFLDCYTTWCRPCKLMDKKIYSNEKVGEIVNDKFISVKLQFDKTSNDNENIRGWYKDAEDMMQQYNVTGYPTYLFFSSNGEIVHQDMGARLFPAEFISIISDALDSNAQYYTNLKKYKAGLLGTKLLKDLAIAAKTIGNKDMAMQIANSYLDSLNHSEILLKDINFLKEFEGSMRVKELVSNYKLNYLDKLSEDSLFDKENFMFIEKFYKLLNSQDPFFRLFYKYPDRIDSIMNFKGFSDNHVRWVIRKEEIIDKVYFPGSNKPLKKNPKWKEMALRIRGKYGDKYSKLLIPESQIIFYKIIGHWKKLANLRERIIKEIPPQKDLGLFEINSTWSLNKDAWDVFLRCERKSVLKNAFGWVNLAIRLEDPNPNVQFLDTKANILYKLGKVKEAILQQKKAIAKNSINVNRSGNDNGEFADVYTSTLNKMLKGEPTWNINNNKK